MTDSRTRIAFGSKGNVDAAILNKIVDQYDIVCLDSGEIGWINNNDELIIAGNTTQKDISVNGIVIPAGTSIDDAIQRVADQIKEYVVEYEFNSYLDFPLTGKAKTLYINKSDDSMYRYDEEKLAYIKLNKSSSGIATIDDIEIIDGNFE